MSRRPPASAVRPPGATTPSRIQRRNTARVVSRAAASLATATALLLGIPSVVAAHSLSGRVNVPLPLVAYLAGAAIAVGLSFLFVLLSDPRPPSSGTEGRVVRVPRWLQLLLRAVGLVGWLWIVAQAVVGGSSDADVASLFLWTYGWVGVALVSAFVFPVFRWLDPISTLHDLGATLVRRLGIAPWARQELPRRLRGWPAVVGLGVFIWLELVGEVLGGRPLAVVLVGYTLVTLAAMAQFGRDEWRADGETFNVWFGVLNRLAPFAPTGDPTDGRLRRRSFAGGLVEGWTASLVVLVVFGTASILYDGISQTQLFFDLFGQIDTLPASLLLGGVLALLSLVVLLLARSLGLAPLGAGLVPVAVGYLLAHYLTSLLVDGQRILIALSDPFQQGWDLIGFAFFEPTVAWIPTSLLWGAQLAAVVSGHVVGAWAGHAAAAGGHVRGYRLRQVPLATLMVVLTTATLWSLGQALVFTSEDNAAGTERRARASVGGAAAGVDGSLAPPDGVGTGRPPRG